MIENLNLWNRFADIDPKYTKAITGKPYKGTSPNPHYVIRCLTEMFGPVGVGFGWEVKAEGFVPLGDEILHWCRIRFWHGDGPGFEAYGQTRALMKTRNGMLSDEDAPKKSLTDAITKAAAQVGVAANIFLGRWDDSRYVADVAAEYRRAEAAAKFEPAPHVAAIGRASSGRDLLAAIPKDHADHPAIRAAAIDSLDAIVKGAQNAAALDAMSRHFSAIWSEVEAAANARRKELGRAA